MKTLNLLFLLFPFFALSQTSLNGTLGESSQQIDGRYYDVYEIKVANTSLKSVEIAIRKGQELSLSWSGRCRNRIPRKRTISTFDVRRFYVNRNVKRSE
jgi:hypothetical protein